MSNLDKTIRLIIAGIIFFLFAFLIPSWLWTIGLIPLLTGYYGWCPLYKIIGKGK
ncbi:MAG: DUF2892 domain-containing protein [Campylobacteraceae bacterium]|jgi:hypothetical protein|nr:DUF2892 domain-containing protein [Campylobacteraceae bacterium]